MGQDMQKLIRKIEKVGAKYGLKLNKNKCVLLRNIPGEKVRYEDGKEMKEVQEAMYLGCKLN